jgi:hypothetical protein
MYVCMRTYHTVLPLHCTDQIFMRYFAVQHLNFLPKNHFTKFTLS